MTTSRKKLKRIAAVSAEGRSADTYGQLLDAVVWAIHEYGYVGATMERIAKRAGFTRGAIQHYFGNRRVDVVAKVTSELLSERQAQYEQRFRTDGAEERAKSRREMKDAFRDPRTWFLIEVWIASRSDPQLGEAINQMQARIESLSDSALESTLVEYPGLSFPVLKAYFRSLTRGLALEYSRHRDPKLFDGVVDLAFDALENLAPKAPAS